MGREISMSKNRLRSVIISIAVISSFIVAIVPGAFAQEPTPVIIDPVQPCFLNQTAGVDMYKNCGLDKDFLTAALLPFEYAVGGNFAMLLITIFIIISYVKYHKVVYPMLIGSLYYPVAYFLYPDYFVTFAILLTTIGAAFLLVYIFIRQSRD